MIRFILDQSLAPAKERLSDERVHSIEESLNDALTNAPVGMVDISFVDEAEIQRLNRMYRGKDSVTDVLSFSYIESNGDFDLEQSAADTLLGDVAICFEQAKRQMQDEDLELELTDLLVHGVLHVIGYDHEKPEDAKRMFPLQDRIVQASL